MPEPLMSAAITNAHPCVFACWGAAEESGRSATVQVPPKHRATRENQNRDSWFHTRSGESAVEELAHTNADWEQKQMRMIGRGDRRGRNKCVKQCFNIDHGNEEGMGRRQASHQYYMHPCLRSDLIKAWNLSTSVSIQNHYLCFINRGLWADAAFFHFFVLVASTPGTITSHLPSS